MKRIFFAVSLLTTSLFAEEKEAPAHSSEKEAVAPPPEKPSSGNEGVRPQLNDAASPTLEPFVISVVKEDALFAYLRLIVQIMIKDPNLVDVFYRHTPRLRDLIFSDIYGAMCDQWLPTNDPEPETFKKRIQIICDKYFGKGKVEVFITHSYLQKHTPKDDTPKKPAH